MTDDIEAGLPRPFTPADVHRGFGRYSQATIVPPGARLLVLSGQLGITAGGEIPPDTSGQCEVIFNAIDACLRDAGMTRRHLVHLTTYLVHREDRAHYMLARDAWVPDPPPTSTLIFVAGLANPAFRVEVEALAAMAED